MENLGMCEGSESELPWLDGEPTSGNEGLEFYTPTMSDPSATTSTASSSSPAYQSARIESLRASRSAYATSLEFEIAASKSHWTDLDSDEETECSPEDNRKYLQSLQLQNQRIFHDLAHLDFRNLVVGKKIAEGGQAEIYEAELPGSPFRFVVKVFKEGHSVRSLHQQWPPQLLDKWQRPFPISSFSFLIAHIEGAVMLDDERFSNRFALLMRRAWGDLRKLIDERMLNRVHKRGCSPPFSSTEATQLMLRIARDMIALHEWHVLHRDLKASNVLVWEDKSSHIEGQVSLNGSVSDFECSVGMVGTGFWRAPEILQQLKGRVPMSEVVFTTKSDVYSTALG